MQNWLPDRIDPRVWLQRGGRLSGAVPVAGMARLGSLLAPGGEVRAELALSQEAERAPLRLDGHLQGHVTMVCQRCLGEVEVPVDVTLALDLVTTEAVARRVPEGREPWLMSGDLLALAELLEDELILAVPTVPRHPAGSCQAPAMAGAAEATVERPHPFSVLARLKDG